MALKRHKHWETRAFHHFLLARAKTPFAWGVNDCALFAADGIRAITGVDIADDFRGKYASEEDALALMKTVLGAEGSAAPTVAEAAAYCAKKHGMAEWLQPLRARRGDLVVFQAPTGSLVAGLVHLCGQIVAVGEKGLFLFPISKALRAWHYE